MLRLRRGPCERLRFTPSAFTAGMRPFGEVLSLSGAETMLCSAAVAKVCLSVVIERNWRGTQNMYQVPYDVTNGGS